LSAADVSNLGTYLDGKGHEAHLGKP
jgi:hypothetical protein